MTIFLIAHLIGAIIVLGIMARARHRQRMPLDIADMVIAIFFWEVVVAVALVVRVERWLE